MSIQDIKRKLEEVAKQEAVLRHRRFVLEMQLETLERRWNIAVEADCQSVRN